MVNVRRVQNSTLTMKAVGGSWAIWMQSLRYRKRQYMQRLINASLLPFLLFALSVGKHPLLAQTPNSADQARKSIVYIFYDAIDPNTGAKSTIQGTGFIVSPRGYVLTASHLFREWNKEPDVDHADNPIHATLRDKLDYVPEHPLRLEPINIGDPDREDVALLKLPDPIAKDYDTAPICFHNLDAAKLGDHLTAYGFPHNQSFQPVSGDLGPQNAPGGRFSAASAFTAGMSGGPVYIGGTVIGLVKGGLDTDAVKWITPIRHAMNQLQVAGYAERCADTSNGDTTKHEIRDWMKSYLQGQYMYAAQVDFFSSGLISRKEALKHDAEYKARWPVQDYTIVPETMAISEQGNGKYSISFKYIFHVQSGDKHVEGEGDKLVVVRKDNNSYFIESIKEQVSR